MKKKYLIVKCEELGDQWECDADRTPITMVADYKSFVEDYKSFLAEYSFEVYELVDGQFELIKIYDWLERGMALYCWDAGANPEECPPWGGFSFLR